MPDVTFAALPTTIFEEMSGLARTHGAINLGQGFPDDPRSEEHTSELQSRRNIVCRLLLEKKKKTAEHNEHMYFPPR